VSRQVAKLDQLGLIARLAGPADDRVRAAVVTPAGKAMTDRIGAARERLLRQVLADWTAADLADLARLLRRFAEAFRDAPRGSDSAAD
jgi:DNA-binding MarR family transcriptional regulator